MEGKELIIAAMARLKVDPNSRRPYSELADRLGLEGRTAPQKLRRWHRGENEPDYKATLALLAAVGLLREKPGRVNRVPASSEVVAELERRAEAVVRRLEKVADRLDPPEDGAQVVP